MRRFSQDDDNFCVSLEDFDEKVDNIEVKSEKFLMMLTTFV